MKKFGLVAFVCGVCSITAANSAFADCGKDLDALEATLQKRIDDADQKSVKDPLVLEMEDGTAVDMRGENTDAKPTEQWFVADKHAVNDVRESISKARAAYESGNTEECERLYEALDRMIEERDQKDLALGIKPPDSES
ncbi:MAG: hypothetical protein P8080_09435 [Gammaproteobacteria bacterium]